MSEPDARRENVPVEALLPHQNCLGVSQLKPRSPSVHLDLLPYSRAITRESKTDLDKSIVAISQQPFLDSLPLIPAPSFSFPRPSMTSSSTCLSPLKTENTSSRMFTSASGSSLSSGGLPKTPTSSQTLSSPTTYFGSRSTMTSSASSDDGSQSSDGSVSNVDVKEEIEPVFSSIPSRRAKSSGSISRPAGSPFACNMSSNSIHSEPTVPPRRIPSFPVSKPIRPFDSITNAMGNNNKRISPPISRAEVPTAVKDEKPLNSKVLDSQLLEVKPKRSNKLLEPPKKSRFQNGFFILDMTQEEFKCRAW